MSKWVKLYSEVKIDDDTVITAQQIKELQKRNAQFEEENLILKKSIAIPAIRLAGSLMRPLFSRLLDV